MIERRQELDHPRAIPADDFDFGVLVILQDVGLTSLEHLGHAGCKCRYVAWQFQVHCSSSVTSILSVLWLSTLSSKVMNSARSILSSSATTSMLLTNSSVR